MPFEPQTGPWKETIQVEDPWYEKGATNEWGCPSLRMKFDETSYRKYPLVVTRCIGWLKAADHTWAIVRAYWPNGRQVGGGRLEDYEEFRVEPVFNHSTQELFPKRDGAGIDRVGFHIEVSDGQENPILKPEDWIDPDLPEVDWGSLVPEITPFLLRELEDGEPMYDPMS